MFTWWQVVILLVLFIGSSAITFVITVKNKLNKKKPDEQQYTGRQSEEDCEIRKI